MSEPLSTLERRVYHYLLDFLAEHSFQPSVREIGKRFRIRSTKTVSDLLASLAAKGFIRREAGRSRGVTLVGIAGALGTQPLALYNSPPDHTSPPAEFLVVDRRLVPADECFLLRLSDGALATQGLLEGDYAMVNPSARANDGDLVAAQVDTRAVARMLVRRGATVTLSSGDPGATDVAVAPGSAAVLGVIVGALRLPGGVLTTEVAPSTH